MPTALATRPSRPGRSSTDVGGADTPPDPARPRRPLATASPRPAPPSSSVTAADRLVATPVTASVTSRARSRAMAALRIVFGLVWAVDAWFKWQPAFVRGFSGYLTDARAGQPQLIKDWIGLWIKVVNLNPHLFARLIALGETGVALGLIFGVFSKSTYLVGGALAAIIWSTAEAFGGPYKAGSTDIGAAIMYVFVFAALWLGYANRTWSLGRRLRPIVQP